LWTLHLPVFPRLPHCLARPRPLLPPAVLLPFGASSRWSCRHLSVRAPLVGIWWPFGACVPAESTYPRKSHPSGSVRVQGFSPPSRFSPLPALRVYFTPLTPLGFSLQGFPLPRSCTGSSPATCRPAVAPAVALPPPRRRALWRTSHPRLGVGQVPLADFTALLPLRVRSAREMFFTPTRGPSPSWVFFLSRVFPVRSDAPVRHRRSSHVLVASAVALPLSRPPSPPEVLGHHLLSMRRR